MPLVELNLWAVLVAAAAGFLLRFLWYSRPLFGRLTAGVAGATPVVSLLCHLVIALVLAVLVSLLGLSQVLHGLGLGFLLWLGVAAPFALLRPPAGGRSGAAGLAETGCRLATLLLMAAILAAWPA